jgi:serine protease Do
MRGRSKCFSIAMKTLSLKTVLRGSLAMVLAVALGAGCHQAARAGQTAANPPAPFASPPMLAGAPDVASLVAKVKLAVVNITTTRDVKVSRMMRGFPNGFGQFFGQHGGDDEQAPDQGEGESTLHQHALGSGILVDAQGHVVTNAHVIDGASVVKIRLSDDREYSARVVGKDVKLDVAVLALEHPPKDLPVASLGSSEALRVGEYVVAIGNPFGLGDTVTMGIVSAKGRAIGAGPYDDFIQTDASINPGNSGGPLFDLHGQVIGINTAINPQGKGIGFAIPIDEVKQVLPQLIARGHVTRGELGVMIQGMDANVAQAMGMDRPHGAIVEQVNANSPAAHAGLQAGDVITSVDGQDVAHASDLPRMIAAHAPGTRATLGVMRDHQTRTIAVTLETMNDEHAQADASSTDSRGELGISMHDEDGHAVVDGVTPGGPADGRLKAGDVIQEVNRHRVATAADATSQLHASGDAVVLLVKRGDQSLFVAIER